MKREQRYKWKRDPIFLGWVFLFVFGFTAIVAIALWRGILLDNWKLIFVVGVAGPVIAVFLQYYSRRKLFMQKRQEYLSRKKSS